MKFFNKYFSKKRNAPVVDNQVADSNDNLASPNMEFSEQEKEQLFEYFIKEDEQSELYEFDLGDRDELFDDAARIVVQTQQSSTSLLQRKFKLGYNRAGRILDQLEAAGIVGPFEGSTSRRIFITSEKSLKQTLFLINENRKSRLEVFYEKYREEIEIRKAEFRNRKTEEEERLEKEKIKQRMLEKERKKRLHKEALKELMESEEVYNDFSYKKGKRESIPQDVMDKVWNRDGGKCVKCESQENLEFDHIIPFSKGGATTYRNLQLMCKKCNIEKSNIIG